METSQRPLMRVKDKDGNIRSLWTTEEVEAVEREGGARLLIWFNQVDGYDATVPPEQMDG